MSGPSDDGVGHFLQSTQPFTRMESPDAHPSARVTTDRDTQPLSLSVDIEERQNGSDVFERRGSADSTGADGQADEGFVLSRSVQDPSEELPIELISLTDR
jgi:hypothetical protein